MTRHMRRRMAAMLGAERRAASHTRAGGRANKMITDFIYYLRRGYGIRTAWKLARITL